MAIEVAKKDLGVRDRPIGPQRIRHAMQAESHLVQVPFEFKPGGVDKRLILRVVRHLGPVKVGVARNGRRLKYRMQSDSGSSRATSGGALRRRYAASATSSRTSKTMMMVALVRLGMQGPVYHPHQSRNDSTRIRPCRPLTIGRILW